MPLDVDQGSEVATAVDEVVVPFDVDVDACDSIDVEVERVGFDAAGFDPVGFDDVGAEDVDVEAFAAVVVVLAVVTGIVCGVAIGGGLSTVFAGTVAGRTRM